MIQDSNHAFGLKVAFWANFSLHDCATPSPLPAPPPLGSGLSATVATMFQRSSSVLVRKLQGLSEAWMGPWLI